MRILLVEDDDRIAKPLAEDLRHQHYVVEIASDGIEGWEYVQAAVRSQGFTSFSPREDNMKGKLIQEYQES